MAAGWLQGGFRVLQGGCGWLQGGCRVWLQAGMAGLLCEALRCRLAIEPAHQLEGVDGHEYASGEGVDLILGEAHPRVVEDGGLVEVHQPGVVSEPDLAWFGGEGGGLGLKGR